MFDIVTKGFQDARLRLKGQARLTEENIEDALNAVKRSLLDADVEFGVVREFTREVKEKCLGEVVQTKVKSRGMSVDAGDHFVEQCQETLTAFLGGETAELDLSAKPAIILLVGLQGAGKTTHAAKISRYLREEKGRKPLLVAADVYRPAARDQLKVLADKESLAFFTEDGTDAVAIAEAGIRHAAESGLDTVIIDTAGRLAIDEELMDEVSRIKTATRPGNVVLVIDAMIGQDAVQTAAAFHEKLGLTGVVLTKLDGDTRGGAALSVKKVTGRPILFAGMGEGMAQLEAFRPDGMASRILGMGDIVGLMGDFKKAVDEEQAERSAKRMMEGHFDFNDFLDMMGSLQKMGPLKDVLAKTPLMGQLPEGAMDQVNDRELVRVKAIVQSMTRQEKAEPDLLLLKNPGGRSRVARIAKGCGRAEKDVRELVDRFMQMRQVMSLMMGGGGGLLSGIPGLGGLNKIAGLAKAMRAMPSGGLGGMPGMPSLPGMPSDARSGLSTAELAAINRERKKKKLAKQQKKKNRR